jgi:hypothetical protein
MKNAYLLALLVTFAAIVLAALYEVFYVRRRKLHRQIASMIGEHINTERTENGDAPLPFFMLERGMNQNIHPTDEIQAKAAIESMLALALESKRRGFLLPLMHNNVAGVLLGWCSESTPIRESALQLLKIAKEREAQHIEQLIAQSHARIPEEDAELAESFMRSLASMVEAALSAGIKIDPKIILFNPNKSTTESWATNDHYPRAKKFAQALLDSVNEAHKLYNL